jgi:2-hydroxy-6-oxonona-2,4-dienedioate hydrolase
MSRRYFLSTVGFTLAGASLGHCSFVSKETSPEPQPPVADVEKQMLQGRGALQHGWTKVNGLQMHSLVSRDPTSLDAPRIVLVHGSGLSGRYMIPTAQQLAEDCRVYVPDLPGFGDSDKPKKVFDVPELADWLAAWMPVIGLERAALLGNSFGCQVIADLASRYPDRVEAAILQGPTTPPDERSWFWQFIRWRQNQRYNPSSLGSVTYDDYKKCGLRRMYRSFLSQLTDRIEDKAPRIQAPVLVIRGAEDPIANQRWCEQIARLCPHGRLVLIPNVAHTLCYTAPVQLANVTRSFLQALKPDQRTSRNEPRQTENSLNR